MEKESKPSKNEISNSKFFKEIKNTKRITDIKELRT